MVLRALERVGEQKVLDVGPHESPAVLAGELAEALVHMADGAVEAAHGNRIACQLDQLRDLG